MTDTTITAFDFYSSLPVDVLMRIRDSHITNLALMNDILADADMEIAEKNEGFFLTDEHGEEYFIGDSVDEALDSLITE